LTLSANVNCVYVVVDLHFVPNKDRQMITKNSIMMTIPALISIVTLMFLLGGNGCMEIERINAFTSESSLPSPPPLIVMPSNHHHHHHHHYSRHFGSQSSSLISIATATSSYSSSTALFATCRICRCTYDRHLLLNNDNDNDSHENENDELLSLMRCVYHPGSLRGESPRKSDWEDNDNDDKGQRKSIDNSKLVYTYTCCGGERDSVGCQRGKHKSYDDP